MIARIRFVFRIAAYPSGSLIALTIVENWPIGLSLFLTTVWLGWCIDDLYRREKHGPV